MEIEIEKNVPIPVHGLKKYPFDKLEVGHSFLVKTKDFQKTQKSLSSAAKHFALRRSLNWKFTVRICEFSQGVRIWRIK